MVRQTWDDHVMDFIYDNTGKPYALKYDGTTYYYVLNLQGDVISIITHWGESYGSYTYDAWGNVLSVSGDIANLNPIRYRGYYYDSETRLYYLQSRYYDSQVKRFINADGYTSVGQGFIGYNMFAYCNNNPVVFCDSNGTEAAVAIIVIAGSAILTGLFTYLNGGSAGEIISNSLLAGAVSGLALFTGAAFDSKLVKIAVASFWAAVGNIVMQDSNSKMDWKSFGIDIGYSALSEWGFDKIKAYNSNADDASIALGGVGADAIKSMITTANSMSRSSGIGARPPLSPITKKQRLRVLQRRAKRSQSKQAIF